MDIIVSIKNVSSNHCSDEYTIKHLQEKLNKWKFVYMKPKNAIVM